MYEIVTKTVRFRTIQNYNYICLYGIIINLLQYKEFMSEKTGRILVVDDNEDILFAIKLLLKPHIEEIVVLNNPEKIPDLLKTGDFDVIFLDMNFTKDASSGKEGFDWLERILRSTPKQLLFSSLPMVTLKKR